VRKVLFFAAFTCTIGAGSIAFGSIFANPITGANPGASTPYTAGQTFDPNVTVSGISRVGVGNTSAVDRYNTNSWNTGAINLGAYITWTITPQSGFEVDFLNFVYTGQTSGTGPNSFAFRSSLDGFIGDIGAPIATGTTISLAAAAFQNITSSIEFRMYAWGATTSAGTFSINDFTFNGEVVAAPASVVPETTSSIIWVGICGMVGLVVAVQKLRPLCPVLT
jgi:hypothetical protein